MNPKVALENFYTNKNLVQSPNLDLVGSPNSYLT